MNAKVLQTNHEVIGQYSPQLKGRESMNSQAIKNSRKRFLSITAAAVLAAAMSSNALAAGSSATVNLENGALIFLDDCPASSFVMASGMSNFAVRFRVRYAPDSFSNKTRVWEDTITSFSVKSDINDPQNSTFPFRPGVYQVNALNTSGRNAKVQLTISCQ